MAKPAHLRDQQECWRALLRARGLYGQGDLTPAEFWAEVEAVLAVAETLPERLPDASS